ncbi:STM3941 family protein [Gracilibacillus saliphilus]|uniref:STM3941 family protein n=1 Tax=Gracilibacillus saliphilus TaxID=543890 RepID=UPI0013D4C014|nr:STM3941 family protein [Gracilibacillus saliphilus]
MKSKNTLYFYNSLINSIFIMFISLTFVVFGSMICWAAFKYEDLFLGLIGLFLVGLFTFLLYRIIKILKESKPLLILSDEELILNSRSKKPIAVKWVDIKEYEIQEVNLYRYININLYDEEKYLACMYDNTKLLSKVKKSMKSHPFTIVWGQVKRKDRDILVDELDRRAFEEEEIAVSGERLYKYHDESKKLSDQLAVYHEERKEYSQVNRKYFLKKYGQSALWALGLTILFSFDKDGSSWMYLSIISFFIYPFAKVIYDVIFGFRYEFKMKKQTHLSLYIEQSNYLFQFLVYIFSLFLAPFGILYLLIRAVYRRIKKRKNQS